MGTHLDYGAGAVLVERHRKPQKDHRPHHVGVLLNRHCAHHAIHRIGTALAQVARDGANDGALLR